MVSHLGYNARIDLRSASWLGYISWEGTCLRRGLAGEDMDQIVTHKVWRRGPSYLAYTPLRNW